MTDEHRKSVILDYFRAFDNGGVAPDGRNILELFAEVLCPVFIVLGVLTRLATLPILFLLAVSVIWVHPEWSLAEGQFAWLLLIVFSTIFIAGSGRLALGARLPRRWPLLREL
jgi:putative oxidoreductase